MTFDDREQRRRTPVRHGGGDGMSTGQPARTVEDRDGRRDPDRRGDTDRYSDTI